MRRARRSRVSTARAAAEDLAADLIEIWGAVEAALRTLVGSTVLSGQALIREARQRQMINFDQANALAEFEAVHERAAGHALSSDAERRRTPRATP